MWRWIKIRPMIYPFRDQQICDVIEGQIILSHPHFFPVICHIRHPLSSLGCTKCTLKPPPKKHPGKFTAGFPKEWSFGRWFSFSIWVILKVQTVNFQGCKTLKDPPHPFQNPNLSSILVSPPTTRWVDRSPSSSFPRWRPLLSNDHRKTVAGQRGGYAPSIVPSQSALSTLVVGNGSLTIAMQVAYRSSLQINKHIWRVFQWPVFRGEVLPVVLFFGGWP